VRRVAAEALGHLRDARAVEPLSAALKDRGDQALRLYAAAALGQIGDASAVQPLVAALDDHYANVRKAAAEALAALGWQPDRTETGAQRGRGTATTRKQSNRP
jgi:HEAT repeat protein